MKNLIINNWLKTYLIGPMENVAKKDGGRGWRDNITLEIMNRVDENNNSGIVTTGNLWSFTTVPILL